MIAATLILIIFIVTLIVIISEKVNETATVLFGMSLAGVVLFFEGIEFPDMLQLIQWDAIIFVTAMMIVVSVAGSSGMFRYIALLLVRGTKGDPRQVFLAFMNLVFVLSFVFDPLPTMLVMGSFTIEVCQALDIDFRPILISEVIVANFASIPSVVGSVPNLVIVVLAGIDVGLMFIALLPLAIIMHVVTVWYLLRYYKEKLVEGEGSDVNLLMMIKPDTMIKSRHDFYLSIFALAILVLGFTLGPGVRLEASLIAMLVASGMLIFSHERAKDLLLRLSWDTVFFLIGLFGLIVALEQTGLITLLVDGFGGVIGDNPFLAILALIWIPGLALSIIDNIPVAALLSPLAVRFAGGSQAVPLSLLIGANVGGYIIPFGDAPNMIAVNLAAEKGKPISFREFTRIAFPLGLLHLVMGTIYMFALVFVLA